MSSTAGFDVVGVGLNATDTLLVVPHFPAYAGKAPIQKEILSPGGQVASAIVACAALGLKTKYIGTVGDDERGRIQLESLRTRHIDIEDVQLRKGCATQSAYIIIDRSTGERTVFWRRDDCLRITPDHIAPEQITCARLLHIDGHDTPAVEHAARIARAAGIPVTVDVDTIYPGFERVMPYADYLIASSEFPGQWTKQSDPFQALETIQREYKMRVAAMTLGAHGALALENGKFTYSPAYVVDCVDTTGAGDVFHGGFCYAVLQRMSMRDALDFSNAMAALNCMALGARGGIAGLPEAKALMATAARRSRPELENRDDSRLMIPLRDTMPSHSAPVVTVFLIAANAFVFLYMLWLDPYTQNDFIQQYALIPARFNFLSLITSMFLHGGWMHVIGNMWFLWIYGDNIEDVLGHTKYLLFYLLCGIAAAIAQFLISPFSRVPMVGASGAIAGVMGAYLIKFPHSRIVTLIPIIIFWTTIEIPAILVLAYWFLLQFFSGVGSIGYSQVSQGGGVAWFAHIGGFIAGMLLIIAMRTKARYSHRTDVSW